MREDWIKIELQDIANKITDGTHKTPKYLDSGVRFISIKNVRPYKKINWNAYEKYISKEEHEELIKRAKPEKDDILFPRIGTLGFAKRVDWDDEFSIFVGLGLIKPNKQIILPKFLEFYMNSSKIQKLSKEKATGTGRLTLPLAESKKLPIYLPPLPEQRAIVAKIEQLFSELDNGIANLKTAQEQLKVYRQAVLKKAFEGDLTKEWRESQSLPSAGDLLTQIKTERENHYQQQLEDWKQAVKAWETNGKDGKKPTKPKKPKELPPLTEEELEKLPNLPDGWKWVKIGESCIVKGGKRLPKGHTFSEQQTDYPYIMAGNLKDGTVKNKITYINKNTYDILYNYHVDKGNLYITIVGACIGDAGIIPDIHDKSILTENAAKIINTRSIFNKYLSSYLNSYLAQVKIKGSVFSATLGKLALNRVEKVEFPLCSIEEQHQIVQEIESRLSVCDKVEENIQESLDKAEALRQSILKKAFEGNLLSEAELAACRQEPDWEPAEKLLERIRAEK